MPKALIFDMDGVIVDSEPTHNKATSIILRRLGINPASHPFDRYVGVAYKEIYGDMIRIHGLKTSLDDIMAMHRENIMNVFKSDTLIPVEGTIRLMKEAKAAGLPVAVASSSSMEMIRLVLDKLGVEDAVDAVVSGEELPRSKPDPAIFLKAAGLLGVEPADCLVIEDSTHGVHAAAAAGMACIGYRNPNSGDQDLSLATRIVTDMMAVSLEQATSIAKEEANG